MQTVPHTIEVATFAAGCFWGVEDVFMTLKGVLETEVGYTGGTTENPTYKDVCYKNTGHAEALKITFDPSVITYDQLLDFFWRMHDPTTFNRQGPDVGSQYRSAIFTHSPAQEEQAKASKEKAQSQFPKKIVTFIEPAPVFYPAEEYHQKYFQKNGGGGCHIIR